MNYFQQILELQSKSPRPGMSTLKSVNSDYTSHCSECKNCYLLIGSERDEDCLYGNWLYYCRDCVDSDFLFKCELCHECTDCENCYNLNFCQDCTTCTDCSLCYDCKGCKNCFGCAGLRNKEFCAFNKQYSHEEYIKKLSELKNADNKNNMQDFEEIKLKTPRLFAHVADNENSPGDYIYHCKNSYACFDGKKLEDCFYMTSSIECKDCADMANSYFGCELSYEVMSSIELYNCNFSNFCYNSRDLEYCEWCFNCSNCFGCFYLQHKQFYIFNQPYKKEDYFKKVEEIKESMRAEKSYGKHLPSTIRIDDSAIANYWRA